MRQSLKYIVTVPVRFICMFGFSFLIMLGILKLVESRAAAYGPIHETLEYYILLLAVLGSISALITMLEYYFRMRISETSLIRYLTK